MFFVLQLVISIKVKQKMKKFYTTIFLSSMVAMATLLPSSLAHAAGAHDNARFTASQTAAAADNNSAITITVFVYDDAYLCANGQVRGSQYDCVNNGGGGEGTPYEEPVHGINFAIAVTGSGNTLSASSITTDSSGHAAFSLKSSVAEAKTISLGTEPGTGAQGSISVTFTAPTTASSPKATAKSSTPTPPPVINPPAALTPESIEIDGKAVTADHKVTMQSDKAMVLGGKTVPNGVVNLYIFSEPKKYTVTADKDGHWTYAVKGLEPGEHHVEAEVTDPTTGKTSSRAQVLAFSVVKPAATAATVIPKQADVASKSSRLVIAAEVVGAALLLTAIAAASLWKFKPATFDAILRRLGMKKESLPPPVLRP
jgi:hypothetical protein